MDVHESVFRRSVSFSHCRALSTPSPQANKQNATQAPGVALSSVGWERLGQQMFLNTYPVVKHIAFLPDLTALGGATVL